MVKYSYYGGRVYEKDNSNRYRNGCGDLDESG